MTGSAAAPAPPGGGASSSQLCFLLACFRGASTAPRVRKVLDKRVASGGGRVLDQVVVRVSGKHKLGVYNPRRTLAGTLTSALTWGLIGLLTGGIASAGIWAIIGAACGRLYGYFAEHLITKNERKVIGEHMPADSAALAGFVEGDAERLLADTETDKTSEASVAAIEIDLSARVLAASGSPAECSTAPAGGGPIPANSPAELSMVLLRYPGTATARHELAKHKPERTSDHPPLQAEMIFETPEHGRTKASDPTQGGAAFTRSDVVGWVIFGLIYGLIVGLVHNHGVFSTVEVTAAAGIICAVLGAICGALYGLWAGRPLSARRIKIARPLTVPGSSTILAWSAGNLTQQAARSWSEQGSERLVIRFNPVDDGVLLEV